MYHPVVNFTNPWSDQRLTINAVVQRTCNTEYYACLSKPARSLVAILQHLEHVAHLLATIVGVVFDNDNFSLRGAVNLDNPMARVRGIRGDDIEAQFVLV